MTCFSSWAFHCLVNVCGYIVPISTWGSLKFHPVLTLKGETGGEPSVDITSVNHSPHLIRLWLHAPSGRAGELFIWSKAAAVHEANVIALCHELTSMSRLCSRKVLFCVDFMLSIQNGHILHIVSAYVNTVSGLLPSNLRSQTLPVQLCCEFHKMPSHVNEF